MQHNRTAPAVSSGITVRGLGVCDVLQLELAPGQRERLARAIDSLALGPEIDPVAAYERRLVALLRAGLPPVRPAEPFPFAGPAGLLAEIILTSTRDAVRELRELAPRSGERVRLHAVADDAAAWLRTFLDWVDVESFNFDPDADPGMPW